MSKRANTGHPVHDIVAERWSPYGLDPKPLDDAVLRSVLEAARWAASSYNEQPWRFILARRQNDEEFQRALSCLAEANRAWARDAGALLLTAISTTFSRNGKPNRVALHDLGLAAATLTFEATARGLWVHQMAGVDLDAVRKTYGVPEGFEPATAIAIGHRLPDEALEGDVRERDTAPRSRKPLPEIVFGDAWGQASALVD